MQLAQNASSTTAVSSSLAAPPQAAALAAPPSVAAGSKQDSSSHAAAGVSMLGALGGHCSQVLPADTPLGGGVVLGCHYQVLQKPWLPLDTAVRQFKVHLSLMATKARLHQQQQQHTGPEQPQQQQQQSQWQQQQRQPHPQQQPPSLPPQPAPSPLPQKALEQPLLLRQGSDSSSNPSNQQLLLPGAAHTPAVVVPAALLHVACDDEGSDSSLGPAHRSTPTAAHSSLGSQAWLQQPV